MPVRYLKIGFKGTLLSLKDNINESRINGSSIILVISVLLN